MTSQHIFYNIILHFIFQQSLDHSIGFIFNSMFCACPQPPYSFLGMGLLRRNLVVRSWAVTFDSASPWTAAHQAFLSFTISQSLLKLMSVVWVMPSNHLILCRPFLLLSSISPSTRVFSSESALHITWPKHWSLSFSISPSNEYSGLISFRIDWFDLPYNLYTVKFIHLSVRFHGFFINSQSCMIISTVHHPTRLHTDSFCLLFSMFDMNSSLLGGPTLACAQLHQIVYYNTPFYKNIPCIIICIFPLLDYESFKGP